MVGEREKNPPPTSVKVKQVWDALVGGFSSVAGLPSEGQWRPVIKAVLAVCLHRVFEDPRLRQDAERALEGALTEIGWGLVPYLWDIMQRDPQVMHDLDKVLASEDQG